MLCSDVTAHFNAFKQKLFDEDLNIRETTVFDTAVLCSFLSINYVTILVNSDNYFYVHVLLVHSQMVLTPTQTGGRGAFGATPHFKDQ